MSKHEELKTALDVAATEQDAKKYRQLFDELRKLGDDLPETDDELSSSETDDELSSSEPDDELSSSEPDDELSSVLNYAVINEHYQMFKLLVKNSDNDNNEKFTLSAVLLKYLLINLDNKRFKTLFDLILDHMVIPDDFYALKYGNDPQYDYTMSELFDLEEAPVNDDQVNNIKYLFKKWPFANKKQEIILAERSDVTLDNISMDHIRLDKAYGSDGVSVYYDLLPMLVMQGNNTLLRFFLFLLPLDDIYECRIESKIDGDDVELEISLIELAILQNKPDVLKTLLIRGLSPEKSRDDFQLLDETRDKISSECSALLYKYRLLHESLKEISDLLSDKPWGAAQEKLKVLRDYTKDAIRNRQNDEQKKIIEKSLAEIKKSTSVSHTLHQYYHIATKKVLLQNIAVDCTDFCMKARPPSSSYCFMPAAAGSVTPAGAWFQLPSDDSTNNICKLLTKLLYRSCRYGNLSLNDILKIDKTCHQLHQILIKLDPAIKKRKTLSKLRDYLERKETTLRDYFGDELSTDSDSEEIKKSKPASLSEQLLVEQSHSIVSQFDIGKMIYNDKLKNVFKAPDAEQTPTDIQQTPSDTKPAATDTTHNPKFKSPSEFGLSQYVRQKIFCQSALTPAIMLSFHQQAKKSSQKSKTNQPALLTVSEMERRIDDDLAKLNHYAARGELQAILKPDSLKTKFVIAQYRGIHYNTFSWNSARRQTHRESSQIDDINIFSQDIQSLALNHELSLPIAQHQAEVMRAMKNNEDPTERAFFCAFQELYTNAYDEFHQLLLYANAPELENNNKNKAHDDIRRFVLALAPKARNPFISTASVPYHALKYAFGLKTYPGHRHERLRPRWDKNGRAERPYSGKAYVYLIPLEDYIGLAPNHVVSMHTLGDMTAKVHNKPERETSFFGHLPRGTTQFEIVAKYPSFHREYSSVYHYKYGLDEQLYQHFKKAIVDDNASKPHSKKRQSAKYMLGEYLCAFNEARLLKLVNSTSVRAGKIVIYQNRFGGFQRVPDNLSDASQQKESSDNPPIISPSATVQNESSHKKNVEKWMKGMKTFVQQRKKCFANTPKEELIDACLCADLARVSDIIKNHSFEKTDYAVVMSKYKNDADHPEKNYTLSQCVKQANHPHIAALLTADGFNLSWTTAQERTHSPLIKVPKQSSSIHQKRKTSSNSGTDTDIKSAKRARVDIKRSADASLFAKPGSTATAPVVDTAQTASFRFDDNFFFP